MTTSKTTESQKEIVITRQFDAPRDKVWQAWTEPEKIEKWWGPRGFTTKVAEMNLSPGGKWTYIMQDKDGNEYPAEGVFREINAPEQIVTSDEFGDSDENEKAAPEGLPTGMINTTTFEDVAGKTRVTIAIMHQSVEDREKHEEMGVVAGFNEQLDKLVEYLS